MVDAEHVSVLELGVRERQAQHDPARHHGVHQEHAPAVVERVEIALVARVVHACESETHKGELGGYNHVEQAVKP